MPLAMLPRPDLWSGEVLRVCLGGGPIVASDTGVPVEPLEPTVLSGLLLLILALFALFGLLRGFDREWRSAVGIGFLYWFVGGQWDMVARWINHFYKLFVFAVVKRGILVDDPTTVWKEVGNLGGLVPTEGSVAIWQIAVFSVGAVAAYVVAEGTGQRPPLSVYRVLDMMNVVIRLLGASLGSVTGYLVGVFALHRLFPSSPIGLAGLRSAAEIALLRRGPAVVLGMVMLLIVFGVLSMNAGRRGTIYRAFHAEEED